LGVMDKNGGQNLMFCSRGQKWWCLFLYSKQFSKSFFIFTLSSKTEVGSAGEQPARDSLMLFK